MDDIQSGELWWADLSGLPAIRLSMSPKSSLSAAASLPSTQALCRRACRVQWMRVCDSFCNS